jgi:hypothetical protein
VLLLFERGADLFSKDQVERPPSLYFLFVSLLSFFISLSFPCQQFGGSPLDVLATGYQKRPVCRLLKKLMVSRAKRSLTSPHPLLSLLCCCQRLSQWLSFHHRAINQNPDQHQDGVRDRDQSQSQDLKRSSLRKVVEISDLFRFITEFVLGEE